MKKFICYTILFLLLNTLVYAQTIECSETKFWGASPSSQAIHELELVNGGISNNGVITYGFSVDVAVCNNLNTATPSPTFYNSEGSNTIRYYIGNSNWEVTEDSLLTYDLINPGGSGDFLYYMAFELNSTHPAGIVRYNGNSFITVHTFADSTNIKVADLAVDSLGNVYFFTGPPTTNVSVLDTITVVSPMGEIIKKYSLSYSTTGATYGLIMIKNTLFIGNRVDGNTHFLLPVTLSSDSAIVGAPISFPKDVLFFDLANCNPNMLANPVIEDALSKEISLYPNPAGNFATIVLSGNTKNASLVVYDITGKQIFTDNITINNYRLSTTGFSNGLYFIKINFGGDIFTKKLVVQH